MLWKIFLDCSFLERPRNKGLKCCVGLRFDLPWFDFLHSNSCNYIPGSSLHRSLERCIKRGDSGDIKYARVHRHADVLHRWCIESECSYRRGKAYHQNNWRKEEDSKMRLSMVVFQLRTNEYRPYKADLCFYRNRLYRKRFYTVIEVKNFFIEKMNSSRSDGFGSNKLSGVKHSKTVWNIPCVFFHIGWKSMFVKTTEDSGWR